MKAARPLEGLVSETSRRFAELGRERPDEIQAFGEHLKRARKAGVLSAKAKTQP